MDLIGTYSLLHRDTGEGGDGCNEAGKDSDLHGCTLREERFTSECTTTLYYRNMYILPRIYMNLQTINFMQIH